MLFSLVRPHLPGGQPLATVISKDHSYNPRESKEENHRTKSCGVVIVRLLASGHYRLGFVCTHELSDGRVAGARVWERYCHGLARQRSKERSMGAQWVGWSC